MLDSDHHYGKRCLTPATHRPRPTSAPVAARGTTLDFAADASRLCEQEPSRLGIEGVGGLQVALVAEARQHVTRRYRAMESGEEMWEVRPTVTEPPSSAPHQEPAPRQPSP